jgi:hypothetical protein
MVLLYQHYKGSLQLDRYRINPPVLEDLFLALFTDTVFYPVLSGRALNPVQSDIDNETAGRAT